MAEIAEYRAPVHHDCSEALGSIQVNVDHQRFVAAIAGLEAARADVGVACSRANEAVAEVDRVAPWIGGCVRNLCCLADERLPKQIRRR